MKIFKIKNFDIFHISTQNVHCGYSLEPPRRFVHRPFIYSVGFVHICSPAFLLFGASGRPCFINAAFLVYLPLRKHAYSNLLKILPSKNKHFQIKNSDMFRISAQNIDCGYSLKPPRRGASNEYPQSIFLSKNNKNNVYPL